jgi:hypothetical protein
MTLAAALPCGTAATWARPAQRWVNTLLGTENPPALGSRIVSKTSALPSTSGSRSKG